MPSNKPPIIKGAVIAKHVSGASNTKIAEDLHISRPTVIRILNEAQIDELIQEGKSGLFQLIPDAIKTYGDGVKADVDRSESFLERMSVLPGKQDGGNLSINNFIGIGNLPRPDFGIHRAAIREEPAST